ncbi:MAG: EF-hand domain-containing protein [Steroidobacterales bacterium]
MTKLPSRLLASAFLVMAGALGTQVALADDTAAAPPEHNLKTGLSLTAQLLQLMDTDKNGKVSKAEFMHFMEAEFDLADKNKDGELDPKELKHFQFLISHPAKGPGR